MKHIMLDLETLGTGYRAAVVAIGACEFDPHGDGVHPDTFYRRISLETAMAAGDVDPSTLRWWLEQSEAARKATFRGEASYLAHALSAFNSWGRGLPAQDFCVWGNGATFDNVVLRSAFKATNLIPAWSFRNDKCYRTVINLVPDQGFERHGEAHNALDDAITQAKYLQKVYRALGL